jgi:hypothetical protein
MRLARRLLLYFFAAFFIAFGLVGLFDPARLMGAVNLMAVNNTGTGEMRGLYGGGFTAFGLTTLAGLRCKAAGSGLLLAMCIICGGIVVGRFFRMVLDHDAGFAAQSALPEIIMAACCYFESRHGLPAPGTAQG